MKKNYFILLLLMLLSAPLMFAQNVETFESYTSGKPTSFTNAGQTFTVITNSCGPANGGTMGVFINGQSYNICSQAGTSTGLGYGVGTGCASSSACGSTSDKFLDNGNSNGTNQVYSIKTTPTTLFTIKYLYVYVSNDHAVTSATSGITFRGKNAGAGTFTLTPSSLSTNSNGFTYIDFVAAGYGSINIDELEFQGGAATNYIAIDNFAWGNAVASLSATPTQTNVACNGGSTGKASVSVSGGSAPYNYSWSPSGGSGATASSLIAGNYTCTITDANSSVLTKTFSITQPSAIATSTAITNVACNGGSNGVASISAVGGAGGYSYLWSNGSTLQTITGLMAGVYTATVTDANGCKASKNATVTQPAALITTTAVTNVACNGGSNGVASISASGGAGGYSYLWSNGSTLQTITGLMAGVYTATVTDANSCTSIKSANVTQPAALVTTTAVTNVACNGGSNGVASITASGGAGGYSYLWSNGSTLQTITGLMAGVYTATVTDANSCTSIKSANVTQPAALVTTTAVTSVACNGGSNGVASISASGGAGGYSYLWSNGSTLQTITGLMAGVYTATVTDANSCTSIKSANVTQPSAIVVNAVSQTNIACFGGNTGAASVSVSGGAGSNTYDWTPGTPTGDGTASVTGLTAGNWTCTVTDANSCTASKTFSITQPTAALTVNAVSQTNIACFGGNTGAASVSASGGTTSYTYDWTPGTPTGDGTTSVTGLTAGNWTCTVTDANSCTASKTFSITQPSALVVNAVSQTNIACFGGNTGAASISVSGGAGSNTYDWTPGTPTGDGTASVTGLTAGNWTCTVTDANSCTASKTFSITQPTAALTVNAVSQTNIACFGGNTGAASVSASGGTTSYTYDWTPGTPTGDGTASVTGLTAGNWTCTVTDANSCTASKTFSITQPTAALTVNAVSQTNIACFGGNTGAASVSASGGTTSYTYDWTPGTPTGDGTTSVTGLTAGNWTCTVTDANSCTASKTFSITQPTAALTVNAVSQTNIACFGGNTGAASVSVSGGTTAYTYDWTPGTPTGDGTASVTGLAAGNWTCTVTDANSCTASKTFSITQPTAALTVNAVSQANIACFGGNTGAASASASGGTGSFTYDWTPGTPTGDGTASVSGLTAGNWTCTVTDANSCSASKTFSITQPTAALTVNAVSQTNIACFGGNTGAASVSASGGTGSFTYDWTPGTPTGDGTASVTGLTAGNWTCTVTDANSCSASKTFSITQPTAALAVNALSQTNVACFGGNTGAASVSVSGGTASYTYNWTPGTPAGDGTASVTGLAAGNWTCTVTDANSCSASKTFTISQPTAALTVNAVSQTNIACFGGNTGAASVSASGGTGAYSYDWTPGTPTGDGTASVTNLTAGNWTCTVTDANSCSASKTFTLTQPASGISASTATTGVNCFGASTGAATVTASGGTGSLTYSWSPSGGNGATASNLSAGNYTCLISDASTCTRTATLVIPQPAAALSATATHTDVSCFGGNSGVASVNVVGGTASYSYTWSPSGGNAATATNLPANNYTVTITDNNGCSTTATTSVGQPASALSATATHTDAGCFGANNGIASVNVTGGTASYSYTWSPSGGNAATATNLPANDYTVTITDNKGCTTTASTSVGQPTAAVSASITHTDVSCNGGNNGAAEANTTGGTAPYSYAWSPSGGNAAIASNLSAGTYTCFITDANTCSASQTVVIAEPAAISAVTSQTNVSCNGGSTGAASIMVSGGTGAYTYSWSPSGGNGTLATNLAADTYTCVITDANNCSMSQQITISEPSAIVASVTHTDVSCNGGADGAADVTVSGGAGSYSYAWTPGGIFTTPATNLSANDYTVTITDANNCSVTETVTIAEPAALTAIGSQTNVTCTGGGSDGAIDVTVSGGTMPYAYNWSPNSGSTATASNLSPGVYTFTVTDAHNCTLSQTYTLTAPAPITNTQSVSICQGQSLVVGTNTYTAAGTYTDVLIAANACDSTVTTILTVNSLPSLTTTASSTVVCDGSPVTLTSVGATTYTWSNGAGNGTAFTPTATATYTVDATDANGCSAQDMITVTVNPTPTVTANATNSIVCSNITMNTTLTGGGATTYTWSGGVTDGVAFTPTTTATYTVSGSDANNCTGTATINIVVTTCIGVEEQVSDNAVQVYPNPFSTSAIISIGDDLVHTGLLLDLYDNTGRLVKHIALDGPQTELKRNELATGLYFYNIVKGSQLVSKGKLVIQ